MLRVFSVSCLHDLVAVLVRRGLTDAAEKERLPYELGWTPPEGETNLPSLGAMITQLELANPDVVAEGLSLGEGSLRDVLSLINPLTGKVANLTCALEGSC